MLVSFGEMERGKMRLMNTLTGAAVCLFVFALGVVMIVKGGLKGSKED